MLTEILSSNAGPAIVTGFLGLISGATGTAVTLFLANKKFKRDARLEFNSEEAIIKLLSHEVWTVRSADVIRASIPTFTDDEFRKTMVRLGATRSMLGEHEVWGLISRNPDLINTPLLKGRLEKRAIQMTLSKRRGMQQQQEQQQQQQQRQLLPEEKMDRRVAEYQYRERLERFREEERKERDLVLSAEKILGASFSLDLNIDQIDIIR